MRTLVTSFLRLCLRIFFRRIEIIGAENIPADRPVIFAVNHPNGLVDPLFLLCFAPSRVSFLAKAPLFGMPVIGWFVRVFEAIPVYRKQDNTTGSNLETFTRSRELLREGASIAIFPEGTTHDDARLRELKTGAARIALGASLPELTIVPTGIYYTQKHVFRSSALVLYGTPVPVTGASIDANGEPPAPEVDALTRTIEQRLHEVTLQADSRTALDLVGRAEDVFSGDDEQPLAAEFDLRRRFVEGYHYLREHDPQRLERLQWRLTQFESELQRARLDVHDLRPRVDAARVFRVLVLLPVAIVAGAINFPTYLLVHALAKRFSKGEGNMIATVKFLAALLLYPLTYLLLAVWLGAIAGWPLGIVAAVGMPLLSFLALRVLEDIDPIVGDVRAVMHQLFRAYGHERLVTEHHALRDEMVAVWRLAETAARAQKRA